MDGGAGGVVPGSVKGDVYSLAIIMQEIVLRNAPFPDAEATGLHRHFSPMRGLFSSEDR